MKKIFLLAALTTATLAFTACGRLNDPDNIWNVTRDVPAAPVSAEQAITGLTPGVFDGTGSGGFYGDVSVAVTIGDDGTITAVEVTDHMETPAFANRAFDGAIPAVIAAGTYQVDTISGATATSVAFLNAVEDAVNQAR